MTGSIRDEKSPLSVDMYSKSEEHKCEAKIKRRTIILTAVIASIITILIIVAIAIGYIFMHNGIPIKVTDRCDTPNNTRRSEEWIFHFRFYDNEGIYESAVINEEEGTALVIARDAYKLNNTNSLLLYDFEQGFLALRIMSHCFVTNTPFPEVSHAKNMIKEGRLFNSTGKPLRLENVVCVNPSSIARPELGPKLTGFCQGVDTKMVDEIIGKDQLPPDAVISPQLNCPKDNPQGKSNEKIAGKKDFFLTLSLNLWFKSTKNAVVCETESDIVIVRLSEDNL